MSRRRGSADDDGPVGPVVMTVVGVVVLVPLTALVLLAAALSWLREGDLRDLDALQRTTADVVTVDDGYKSSRDKYVVAFAAEDGTQVRARIPVDVATSRTERLDVAYVPDDPQRVRTVQEWQPFYEQALLYAVLLVVVWPVLVLWEVVRALARRVRRASSAR